MKILVVGSGGREHALVWSFARSKRVEAIYCAKGNAGISRLAECVDIGPEDVRGLADFAAEKQIDLTFVGPENSLAAGVFDEFESRGLRLVGVSRSAARLESSKGFAKEFMARHGIPTAGFEVADSAQNARGFLESGRFGSEESPVVVKADGLAAGKGVVVANNRKEGLAAIDSLVAGELSNPEAAEKIVLEECLFGREVSILAFADGRSFALMPAARDHKRIGEGDTGPNTGGMGTITDPGLLSPHEKQEILETIVQPSLDGAAKDGFPIKGILFLGLMMTASGPKVLEYNMRFGDPEAQAILVNLESDIVEVCEAMLEGNLDASTLTWKEGSSACVILAAENYPSIPRSGDKIEGLSEADKQENVEVFHAGTELSEDGMIVTSGGRVLAVTAVASNLSNSLHRAYKAVNEISWPGMQFRRDIGA